MTKREAPQAPAPSPAPRAAASPLRLVVRSPEKEILQDRPPFLLCHGAEHRLEVKAPDGSSWAGQPLSLLWMTSNEGLPGRHGLSTEPPLHMDNGDETDRYQILSASGADWQLDAAITDDMLSGDVTLGLGSYWQAPKYEIKAQLGHFHYSVTELAWDGVVPISEEEISTTLTATVTNPFFKAHAMQGVEVVWQLNGREYKRLRTDGRGQSKLTYTVARGDLDDGNRVTLSATCTDELEQASVKAQTLPAFYGNPWPDELTMEIQEMDGKPIEPTPQGMRLTRGGRYKLVLKPKRDDSYFIDQPITLRWLEGSKQLGIDFTPKAAQTMSKSGISWEITGGAESGVFNLEATVPGLDVAFLLSGVQMSANLAFEADLSYDPYVPGLPPIFQRGVPKAVWITPKPGSPLGVMALRATLKFVSLEDDDLTSGQVPATPRYGEPSEVVGEPGVAWSLKASGSGIGGRFGLEIEMPGFKYPLEVREAFMMSSGLGNEAKVFVDGLELSNQPLVLRRKKQHVVTLVPRESKNSPLGKTGLRGQLNFTHGSLTEADLVAVPPYKAWQTISEEGLGWTLTGQEISGTCNLEIKVEGFATSVVLENVLVLSETLSDEAEVKIDGEAGSTLMLRRKVPRTVSIVPKAGSPLGLKGYLCSMSFRKGSLEQDSVATSTPYGDERNLEVGGLDWILTGEEVSGTFSLDIDVKKGFGAPLKLADAILLSEDLNDEADLEIALSAPDVAPIFQAGVEKTVRIVPKDGSPLALANLAATLHFEQREDQLTAAQLTPKNLAYEKASPPLTSEGFTWTIGPNDARGEFGLHVTVSNFSTVLNMEKGYLMSSHLRNDVRVYLDDIELGAEGAVLRRKKRHTLKMVPRDTRHTPIGRTGLKGWIEFTPGSLSKDKVTATPGYEDKRTVTPTGLSWTLEGKDLSGTCALDILVEGFATPRKIELVRLLSEQLSDEVDVKFDNAAIKPPLVLRRKQGHKIKVVPKAGSPLAQMTDRCGISFEENGSLKAGQVPASPPYTDRPPMNPGGLEWTLTGQEVSGTFGLNFNFPGFPPLDLGEAMLLSSKLGDEVEMTLGGKLEQEKPVLWREKEAKVVLRLKEGSPLNGNMTARLMFLKKGGLEQSQVPANPSYGENNVKPVDSLSWTLTGPADKSGLFGLEVYAEGFTHPARWEKAIVLSTYLFHEVNVIPDRITVPVSSKGGASIVAAENSPIYEAGLDVHVRFNRNGTEVSLRGVPPFDSRRIFDQSRAWELHWQAGIGTVGLDFHVGDGGVYSVSRYVYVGTGTEPSESCERGSHTGLRTDRDTPQGDDSLLDTAPEE